MAVGPRWGHSVAMGHGVQLAAGWLQTLGDRQEVGRDEIGMVVDGPFGLSVFQASRCRSCLNFVPVVWGGSSSAPSKEIALNMDFHAAIDILPLPGLLDPQGKAVTNNLPNIGLGQLTNVRIGKHITLDIEAGSREEAEKLVAEACEKLLSNPIMERFEFRVFSAEEAAL